MKITGGRDRRLNNNNDKENRSDPNLDDRIHKFKDLINQKQVYRIPLQYLIDIVLANFPESFTKRFIFTLQDNYSKLFESNAKVDMVPKPDRY